MHRNKPAPVGHAAVVVEEHPLKPGHVCACLLVQEGGIRVDGMQLFPVVRGLPLAKLVLKHHDRVRLVRTVVARRKSAAAAAEKPNWWLGAWPGSHTNNNNNNNKKKGEEERKKRKKKKEKERKGKKEKEKR